MNKLEIFIPRSMDWEETYQSLKHFIHSPYFQFGLLTNPLQETQYQIPDAITDKIYTWYLYFY